MGTNNKLNNAIAAIQALAKYKVGKFPEKNKKTPDEAGSGGEETAKKSTKKPAVKKSTDAKETKDAKEIKKA